MIKLLAVCRRRREAVGPIANPSPKMARCAKFAMFYTPYVPMGLSGLAIHAVGQSESGSRRVPPAPVRLKANRRPAQAPGTVPG